MNQSERAFEVAPETGIRPVADRRPRMFDPLPVNLIAIEDVRLPTPGGVEAELDAFYVDLLGFERMHDQAQPTYRAENFCLRFDVAEPGVVEHNMRPQGIEVASLAAAVNQLTSAEIEYEQIRGLAPGQESLLLRDPAGNWIELVERREIA
jgi:catechol-2,3-dioxygenase